MNEYGVFETEKEFREYFEKNLEQFNVKEIIVSQEPCPDYILIMNHEENDSTFVRRDSILRVEAELWAKNFKKHNHDPNKVDLIIFNNRKMLHILKIATYLFGNLVLICFIIL